MFDICDDPSITFVLDEVTFFAPDEPMSDYFVSSLPCTPAPNVDHPITLGTGEEGVLRVCDDGRVFVFLDEPTVTIPGACVTITCLDPPTCPDVEHPTPKVVEHTYEYNHKRVNPCE